MPQYYALKTFDGRFGRMNRGMTYTLPDGYGRDLQHNKLVRPISREKAPQTTAHEGAPRTKGEDTAAPQDAGAEPQPSVSLRGRASRKPTVPTSNRGG